MVVWVRNTFNPQARGTRIGTQRSLRIREQRRRSPFQLNKAVRHEFPISKRRRSKHAGEATGEKVEGGSPWRYRSSRPAPLSNARRSSVVRPYRSCHLPPFFAHNLPLILS